CRLEAACSGRSLAAPCNAEQVHAKWEPLRKTNNQVRFYPQQIGEERQIWSHVEVCILSRSNETLQCTNDYRTGEDHGIDIAGQKHMPTCCCLQWVHDLGPVAAEVVVSLVVVAPQDIKCRGQQYLKCSWAGNPPRFIDYIGVSLDVFQHGEQRHNIKT